MGQGRSIFNLSTVTKHWGLIPLVCADLCMVTLATGITIWQLNTCDIMVNRRRKPINERVDLLQPRSLKIFTGPPPPAPQLHEIYAEMKKEQTRRDKELEDQRRQAKRKRN